MTLYQFAGDHPIITLCIVYMLTRTIFLCWNRACQVINVGRIGWPPPHCDADRDFAYNKDKDEEDR